MGLFKRMRGGGDRDGLDIALEIGSNFDWGTPLLQMVQGARGWKVLSIPLPTGWRTRRVMGALKWGGVRFKRNSAFEKYWRGGWWACVMVRDVDRAREVLSEYIGPF